MRPNPPRHPFRRKLSPIALHGRIGWNRIPEAIRGLIVDLALDQPELSPRELAVRFTDEKQYFVSEALVYRFLKARDLITRPAYIVIKAAEAFSRQALKSEGWNENKNGRSKSEKPHWNPSQEFSLQYGR